MSKMHCSVVYCVMFYDLSCALQLQAQTPPWEKWFTELASIIFIMY